MKFAEQLREAMAGMSQEALEGLSGIPQTTISRYLRGESAPNVSRLETLERVLPRLRELRSETAA